MATAELQVELNIILPREFLMERRRALLTELDALEKLLGIAPRTQELRRASKALNPPPQYQCELEYNRREESE